MPSETLIMGSVAAVFGVASIVLWQDYLSHSSEVYAERDAIQAEITQFNQDLAAAQDVDELAQLNDDKLAAEVRYQEAERRINDFDGWNATEWKVKNSARLAAPAVAVLFSAFTLLSIFNPLRPRYG